MADDGRNDFHKRLARLDKQERVKTRATSPNRMGIYDFDEENRMANAKFPWRRLFFCILFAIIGLIAVKAYIAKDMGEEAYQARRAELAAGSAYQRFASILIARDPIMVFFENTLFQGVKPDVPEDGNKNASDGQSEAPSQ